MSLTKRAGSGSGFEIKCTDLSKDPDPDPYQNITDQEHSCLTSSLFMNPDAEAKIYEFGRPVTLMPISIPDYNFSTKYLSKHIICRRKARLSLSIHF